MLPKTYLFLIKSVHTIKKLRYFWFIIWFLRTFGNNKTYVLTFKQQIIMKGLSILAAFLGGAAVGAACGILFAPEKGTDTREKIAAAIRKRGIKLNSKEMESLVDDIADELQPAND